MKNIFITILFFFLSRLSAQIIVINTGTTTNLQVSVIGSNILINGQDNYLVKSYDECNTLLPLVAPGLQYYQNYLCRVNTNVSFILSTNFGAYNNKLYETIDGGNNWIQKYDTSNLIFTQFGFFDANEGIAISTANKLVHLKNGGSSRFTGYQPFAVATCIRTFADSMVCLGGDNSGIGLFLLSKDRGNTWYGGSGFNTLSETRDCFFLSKDTIFAVSSKGYFGPFFAKTFNGGSTWQKNTFSMDSPNGIYFKSRSEGYIVGMANDSNGVILKTTDLGQNWITYNIPIKSQLLNLDFINDSVALVYGTGGVLFKWNSKQAVPTGFEENSLNNLQLKIFPNPVKDKLSLEFSNTTSSEVQVSIQNTIGQVVYEQKVNSSKQEIDLGQYASGIYFLKVQNNVGQKVFKIVKE